MKELSHNAKHWLTRLGDYQPVKDPLCAEVKGWIQDNGGAYKDYFDIEDLIQLSDMALEVANWLKARKAIAEAKNEVDS
jgi:hypothetical protein